MNGDIQTSEIIAEAERLFKEVKLEAVCQEPFKKKFCLEESNALLLELEKSIQQNIPCLYIFFTKEKSDLRTIRDALESYRGQDDETAVTRESLFDEAECDCLYVGKVEEKIKQRICVHLGEFEDGKYKKTWGLKLKKLLHDHNSEFEIRIYPLTLLPKKKIIDKVVLGILENALRNLKKPIIGR